MRRRPIRPPDVPNLDEAAIGTAASLRQQLEAHRKNPTCASCHRRMDPLGFGLENFDAVGAWRTMDGKFPIDAEGQAAGRPHASMGPRSCGRSWCRTARPSPACLTSKLMTYALGRGLERYDKPDGERIASRLPAEHDYGFSGLVLEIVNSLPFQIAERSASSAMIITRKHLPRRTFLRGHGRRRSRCRCSTP